MSKQYHWDGISLQPHVSYNSPQPQSAYAIVLDHPSERISNVHISNHLQSVPAVSYSPWSPSHISDGESIYLYLHPMCSLKLRFTPCGSVTSDTTWNPCITVWPRRAFKIIWLLYLVAAYFGYRPSTDLPSKNSYLESKCATKVCCVGYVVDKPCCCSNRVVAKCYMYE